MTSKRRTQLSFAESFMLSGAATVVSKTATAPIERVKLLVQCQGEMLKQGVLDKPYNGILDCTRRTMAREGLLSFWRGNLASVLGPFPAHALNFALKDALKALFVTSKNASYGEKVAKNILSGGCAGSMTLAAVYSLGYARTRLANDVKSGKSGSSERKFNGLIDVYRKTLRSDGIRGLYRGFFISCGGIFIYRGIYFGLYDSLKPILAGDNTNVFTSFFLGYGVTLTAGLITYPIDTLNKRMMMTSGEAVKYKNSLDCGTQIVRNEGFMALMKGASINILRSVAGAAVLIGYDAFKGIFVGRRVGS